MLQRHPLWFLEKQTLKERLTLSSLTRTSLVPTVSILPLPLSVSLFELESSPKLTTCADTNLTNANIAQFNLVGNSSAIANLSIGQITLNPIKVNVPTHLLGLQGLKGMTQITGVDVAGGTTDHINLNINGNTLV